MILAAPPGARAAPEPSEGGLQRWDAEPSETTPSEPGDGDAGESAGLPTYADAPAEAEFIGGFDAATPELPRDGRGRVASGALLLGAGLVVFGTSMGLLYTTNDPGLWIAGASVSSLVSLAGGVTLGVGLRQRKYYGAWLREHGSSPPTRGVGMRAAGTTAIVGGSAGLIFASVALANPDPADPPYPEVVLAMSLAGIASGITLVVYGNARARAFRAWELDRSGQAAVQLRPSFGVAPLRGGGFLSQAGLSGRF
ncbi:hypothetical protein PPSIR1_02968 [Plesiocystis pacifica SIR-1]|uniref:Uncharacterized protein n=2 Tax=Plesiocystis pacifica TaxID=191768 RepID=A6G964_9BACT|nr:hypothetical protein PPSIR1_02968 [Plesiocystis pacifica SIR-1]